MNKRILVLCTTDSMIYNFLIPHIRDLQLAGNQVFCACSQTGKYYDYLVEKYGLNVERIDFERNPYNLHNIKAYGQLQKLISNKGIDVIFCHEPVGGAMGRVVGHMHHCKVVYMVHGFHFYKGASKKTIVYYWVEKCLSHYTDVLITINQEDYEAAKLFSAKRVVKTNGIGVDTSRFVFCPNKQYF